ncbi:hypothetical protein GCK72_011464 [Caenorhabditis remanei]|uniref:Uncharacterized protein n=1 Tax=Caenorhabditis remanei TaxID=31234 RepID=A0A6A5H635_CAERE|nr:hypothetical protein GCK72_011464 [Caenorhabditis remanei]KAF1763198.1 hypothetical protein GCK72_011464 [Caenorhabditis remanei]
MMRLPLLLILLTGLATAWLGHLNHPIRDAPPNYKCTGNNLMNCVLVESQLDMIRHAIYVKNWKLLAQLSEIPMTGENQFPGNTLKSHFEITKVYTSPWKSVITPMTVKVTVEKAGLPPRNAEMRMEKSEESLTGWKIYEFEWIGNSDIPIMF